MNLASREPTYHRGSQAYVDDKLQDIDRDADSVHVSERALEGIFGLFATNLGQLVNLRVIRP